MQPAKPWHLPALVGAGGIRSTADDMLRFAAAALDPQSPIGPAMATTLANRVDGGNPRAEQALGWQVVHPEPGRDLLIHNGGTGGFRSALALEPDKGRAAVVLVNSGAEPSATDLAMHVLLGSPVAPTPPVPPAPPRRSRGPKSRCRWPSSTASSAATSSRPAWCAITREGGTLRAKSETVPARRSCRSSPKRRCSSSGARSTAIVDSPPMPPARSTGAGVHAGRPERYSR